MVEEVTKEMVATTKIKIVAQIITTTTSKKTTEKVTVIEVADADENDIAI